MAPTELAEAASKTKAKVPPTRAGALPNAANGCIRRVSSNACASAKNADTICAWAPRPHRSLADGTSENRQSVTGIFVDRPSILKPQPTGRSQGCSKASSPARTVEEVPWIGRDDFAFRGGTMGSVVGGYPALGRGGTRKVHRVLRLRRAHGRKHDRAHADGKTSAA